MQLLCTNAGTSAPRSDFPDYCFCPSATTSGFAHVEADQVESDLQYNQLIHLPGKAQFSSSLTEELEGISARKQPTDSDEVDP